MGHILLIAVSLVLMLYSALLYLLVSFLSIYVALGVVAATAYVVKPHPYRLFGIGSSNIDQKLLNIAVPSLEVDTLTFALISDTHGHHNEIDVSILRKADVLLVSGDITANTKPSQVKEFARWLTTCPALPPAHRRVVIAGNHDPLDTGALLGDSCVYLENSSCVLEGVRIYGSPHTPLFKVHTSFQLKLAAMRQAWKRIPENVDILMTHGPPKGILDQTFFGMHVGDVAMKEKLSESSFKPRMIQFGHIHEGYGACKHHDTLLVNASTSSLIGKASHAPVLVTACRV